jgi:hypothetical protein
MLGRDLLLVHPDIIWILIPLVAIIGGFITKWQRVNAEIEMRRGGNNAVADELREAIRRLDTRVANLERAVTTSETERKYAL